MSMMGGPLGEPHIFGGGGHVAWNAHDAKVSTKTIEILQTISDPERKQRWKMVNEK